MEARNTQAVQLGDPSTHEALELSGLTLAEAPWGTTHKVAFRFVFCYILLYLFPPSVIFRWFLLSKGAAAYEALWHKIVPWFAAHILHLSYPITVFTSAGSDTTYEYVKVVCYALVAALATLVWSVLDRKRAEYSKLDQWIRFYVRLTL